MEIITTHTNTDLDALASMVAAKKLYPEAQMVFPGKLSRNVEEFMSLHKDVFTVKTGKDIDLNKVKRVILVDTKNPKRVNKLAELFSRPGLDVHIYDHHPWTEGDARGSLEVVELIGATVTLLVERIKERGIEITPLEATIMALGIHGDTGSLLFTSTTARDAAAVAFLIEKGANLGVVSEFLGRPMTEDQKDLLKALLMSAERHVINGVKVLIARAETREFVVGLSLLTHTISEIERLDAIFTVVLMEDRVHVVGRSNIPQVNAAEILGPFMGGGHPAAASATVKNGNVNEVAEKLVKTIQEKVKPPLSASDIMSFPVKTVFEDATIAEASRVMMRYGHSGLPVVEGLALKGVISRRDVEKAMNHGLGHAPVKGYMTANVVTVHPNMPVAEVREIMIENDIGRVPVVDGGRLVGIVSRTDVLKTLHGDFQNGYHVVHGGRSKQSLYNNIAEVMRRGLSPSVLGILRQAGDIAGQLGCRVYAAGGVVRDLLVGYENIDVDIVVEGDGIALAEAMAGQLGKGARVRAHRKFGTAELFFPDGFKVDVATARVEYYEYPAALPQVESSSLRQDLYRRDFTINAMAVSLNPDSFGELVDYFGGREDLHYGLVRVLYNLSFIEDPTRILRAVRFEQRYKMRIEPQTLKLLEDAVRQEVLLKVSNDRLWDELSHIMMEPEAGKMFSRLDALQVWPQVLPDVSYWEVQPVLNGLNKAIRLLKEWGFGVYPDPWLPVMIAVLHWSDAETAGKICRKYSLSKRQTEKVLTALENWQETLAGLWKETESPRMSDLAGKVSGLPGEAYPLLLALLDEDRMKKRFRSVLTAIRDNRPLLGGEYIRSLGYKPGPIYRRALNELWRARMDGLVLSEDQEREFLEECLKKLRGEMASC
ncbi:MAG: CBS domain-containing protein [Peptococcaceae bacterium]|nr:CBS domain-containing protein [Peptococcaceae bacterium]